MKHPSETNTIYKHPNSNAEFAAIHNAILADGYKQEGSRTGTSETLCIHSSRYVKPFHKYICIMGCWQGIATFGEHPAKHTNHEQEKFIN